MHIFVSTCFFCSVSFHRRDTDAVLPGRYFVVEKGARCWWSRTGNSFLFNVSGNSCSTELLLSPGPAVWVNSSEHFTSLYDKKSWCSPLGRLPAMSQWQHPLFRTGWSWSRLVCVWVWVFTRQRGKKERPRLRQEVDLRVTKRENEGELI